MSNNNLVNVFRLGLAVLLLAGCAGPKKDPIPKFNKGARVRVEGKDESPSVVMYTNCMIQESTIVGVAGRNDETEVIDRMLRFKSSDGQERACTGDQWWYKIEAGEPPVKGWLPEEDLSK